MKNDVRTVVSDADGVKDIWKKYMEKLLNDWHSDVTFWKKRFQQLLKDYKL